MLASFFLLAVVADVSKSTLTKCSQIGLLGWMYRGV